MIQFFIRLGSILFYCEVNGVKTVFFSLVHWLGKGDMKMEIPIAKIPILIHLKRKPTQSN